MNGSGGALSALAVTPTRLVPYSDAILPGAKPWWLLAALTAARGWGAGPMLNPRAFEAPPPVDGLNTSMSTTPTAAISLARICAVRCWLSTTLLERLNPFHRSVVPFAKCVPVTEIKNSAPPASAVFGDKDWMVGLLEAEVDDKGISRSHTPRPCVAARRIRAGRCSTTDSTTTRGRPLPRLDQDTPPLVVTITPASVPM